MSPKKRKRRKSTEEDLFLGTRITWNCILCSRQRFPFPRIILSIETKRKKKMMTFLYISPSWERKTEWVLWHWLTGPKTNERLAFTKVTTTTTTTTTTDDDHWVRERRHCERQFILSIFCVVFFVCYFLLLFSSSNISLSTSRITLNSKFYQSLVKKSKVPKFERFFFSFLISKSNFSKHYSKIWQGMMLEFPTTLGVHFTD